MNHIIDNIPFFSKLFVIIDFIDRGISFEERLTIMYKVDTFANR